MVALSATFGGAGGGGGGVALSAVIPEGEIASNFNSDSWIFSTVTCTASGGTPPYSYAWTYPTTSGGSWGFTGASNVATVTPAVSGVSLGAGVNANLICTVTDSAGSPAVVASNQTFYFYENIF